MNAGTLRGSTMELTSSPDGVVGGHRATSCERLLGKKDVLSGAAAGEDTGKEELLSAQDRRCGDVGDCDVVSFEW